MMAALALATFALAASFQRMECSPLLLGTTSKKCEPGYHVLNADQCISCSSETYMDHYNAESSCLVCDEVSSSPYLKVVKNCTRTANTVLGCKEGFQKYLDKGGNDFHCAGSAYVTVDTYVGRARDASPALPSTWPQPGSNATYNFTTGAVTGFLTAVVIFILIILFCFKKIPHRGREASKELLDPLMEAANSSSSRQADSEGKLFSSFSSTAGEGKLFSSFSSTAGAVEENLFADITPMAGKTQKKSITQDIHGLPGIKASNSTTV